MSHHISSYGPNIKFSILVPVYNVEKYLDECIQSVLNQSYPNYELILVDDGSADSSGNICDQYAARNPCIKSYHKLNGGQLHTRKYALDRATGEYCVFLDSDDYLEPSALVRIHAVITYTNPDCVIYGMSRVKDHKVLSVMQDVEECTLTDKRLIYRKCLLSTDFNSVCRKCVKTSVLQGLSYDSYYQIRHGEDLLQSLDILKNSHRITFIKDILYNYRVNPDSVTQTIRYENFHIDNTVRESVLAFLKDEEVFSFEDFEDYHRCCVKLIIQKLYAIISFDVCTTKKIELLNELNTSDYHTTFISSNEFRKKSRGYNTFLYKLFQTKQYRLLIHSIRIIQHLKAIVYKLGIRK